MDTIKNRNRPNSDNEKDDNESIPSSDCSSVHGSSEDLDEENEIRKMAHTETERVDSMRELVTGAIIIATTLVTFATFIALSHQQIHSFVESFENLVQAIEEAAVAQEKAINETFSTLADTITTHALLDGSVWPFVTLPFFEISGGHARKSTNVFFFAFSPIVNQDDRKEWELYASKNKNWMVNSWEHASLSSAGTATEEDAIKYEGDKNNDNEAVPEYIDNEAIPEYIYNLRNHAETTMSLPTSRVEFDENKSKSDNEIYTEDYSYFAPIWQTSPPPQRNHSSTIHNFNTFSSPQLNELYLTMKEERGRSYSGMIDPFFFDQQRQDHHNMMNHSISGRMMLSVIFEPVYPALNHLQEPVGILQIVISWEEYLLSLRPKYDEHLTFVLRNTCGEVISFLVGGKDTNDFHFMGIGDLHDEYYTRFGYTIQLLGRNYRPVGNTTTNDSGDRHHVQEFNHEQCFYTLTVYPTYEYLGTHTSSLPSIFTVLIASTFIMMAISFFVFDKYVKDRNEKMIHSAARTNAIVSSLFPTIVRDRLLSLDTGSQSNTVKNKWTSRHVAGSNRMKSYLAQNSDLSNVDQDNEPSDGIYDSKPVADFFPNTTLMFADIVGFTAWSSVREPSQVFTLLETIFRSFDEIAKRRRVFKVETVGDCYVAVTGLPEPRKDHAIVMARFARDCLYKVNGLTKTLEVTLGPDTGDLSMRFGLHSGPVTAGVLRGQRARFQLFGDAVNTASRIESTGQRGRIHISQETAELLSTAGKGDWVKPREDTVFAKGKGEMKTYWLVVGNDAIETASSSASGSTRGSSSSSAHDFGKARKKTLSDKTQRLIDWNVSLLHNLLKQVAARRRALNYQRAAEDPAKDTEFAGVDKKNGQTVFDEVQEIIYLPKFDPRAAKIQEDHESVQIDQDVTDQLYDYVSTLAVMYRKNPFHCFEHASHVTMSVAKLLSRIVAPADIDYTDDRKTSATRYKKKILSQMHDHTYGITSDPLTQFSVVLSALIHDADHVGLPNATLVKEKHTLASVYKNKSIAEQNSVDLAWNLLMSSQYDDLRAIIYCNSDELKRFRQLVVNTVLATDICDKELKALRDTRWDQAFNGSLEEDDLVARNRKATIVIEHLIQASDVAHTMQHWHIYRKWNEKFFFENYTAYKSGHAEKNPSEFWYNGELGFFDFYVIPLAKKLNDCGVFGVSSDEYLNYALKNREEWAIRGEKVVAEMVANCRIAFEKGDLKFPAI